LLRNQAPVAIGVKSSELVVNAQNIKRPEEIAYYVALAGLQKAQIDSRLRLTRRQRRRLSRQLRRPAAATQAAARLLSGDLGKAPKGYRLASRVAEWHARQIAQATGRDPIEVLLSRLKIQSGVESTSKPAGPDVFRPKAS
jgi:hypothetical protein